MITRYNLYPSASITGEPAPGFSSGQALAVDGADGRQRILPPAWATNGPPCRTRRSGSAPRRIYVFALAVLLVYLVLAGQYESWITPLAVILVVPLALLGRWSRWPVAGWTTTSTPRSASC